MRRLLWLLALVLAGCATSARYVAPERRADPTPALPPGDVAHRVFLIGNTADGQTDAVLRALAADARPDGDAATVVLLGDLTADGLPDDAGRADAERPVRAAITALRGLHVRAVPGDRDWALGADGIERLGRVLGDAFGDGALASGDPDDDRLADGLRLVSFDSAQWLRGSGQAGDVLRDLSQIVTDRDDDRIVVVAHNALASRGVHAGYRQNPAAALLSQTFGTSSQDLAAPTYRQMRDAIGRVLQPHDGLVYAAASDRVLAVLTEQPGATRTDLVSGTGGGRSEASGGGGALFAGSQPGYQRLVYYADGRLWTETVEVDLATAAATVVFRTEVAGPTPELLDPELPPVPTGAPVLPRATVTRSADADFVTGRFHTDAATRLLLGSGYRDAWRAPATFPVLDLGAEGLTPVKRGGGLQTTALRLAGADGHQYTLRLLEKSSGSVLPPELSEGLAHDVSLQLRATMTPYGALVAAPLARTAGVAQASPRLVFVPDDAGLGRYRETFGERLALLEVHLSGDLSDLPGFAGFTDVVSGATLRARLRDDPAAHVDQRAYLRARLFDMLLNDWDRHADQWRWAAVPDSAGTAFVAVARDRDMAFYRFDGLLQPLVQRLDARAQPFRASFGSISGLTQLAYSQDRHFLNALTLADWTAVARDLEARLAGDAIPRAVRALPSSIEVLVGEDWRTGLEARRTHLVDLAGEYYRRQARVVDVIGTDRAEAFDAVRQADGSLDVTVRTDDGTVRYRRLFRPDETAEVRLYGLGGRDAFAVSGSGPARITLRVIGGDGRDALDAADGHVGAYDTPDGLSLSGRGIRDERSTRPDATLYDPDEQTLGDSHTYPAVSYEATNGLELGAQRLWVVPGFRLHPYAATHRIAASVSTRGGLQAAYDGRMRQAVGPLDLDVDALAATPRQVFNFYGFGNGTPESAADLAHVRLARVEARAALSSLIGQGVRLSVGPEVRYADASRSDSLLSPLASLTADALRPQVHAGASARLALSTADRALNPRRGVRIGAGAAVLAGLNGPAETYGRVGGEMTGYLPVGGVRPVTLALRAAAEHRIGAAPFFDAAALGGPTALRGFRRERYTGLTSVLTSAEVRAKLFDAATYVAPFQVGALAFVDAGRVWGSPAGPAVGSDAVHVGYGGGVWVGVLDRAVVNVTVGASSELTTVMFGLGFAY